MLQGSLLHLNATGITFAPQCCRDHFRTSMLQGSLPHLNATGITSAPQCYRDHFCTSMLQGSLLHLNATGITSAPQCYRDHFCTLVLCCDLVHVILQCIAGPQGAPWHGHGSSHGGPASSSDHPRSSDHPWHGMGQAMVDQQAPQIIQAYRESQPAGCYKVHHKALQRCGKHLRLPGVLTESHAALGLPQTP